MVECSGEEGFMIWCFKIAQTERYSCLAYTNDIGTELEEALAADNQKVVESMVERTLTEALKSIHEQNMSQISVSHGTPTKCTVPFW